jgi:predicted dehydrogenase
MNKKTLRVGVIGLGVGEQHLKGYTQIPNVVVSAVADLNISHAQKIVQKYKLQNVFVTQKPHLVLSHDRVDAVSICSYDNHHAQQAIRAFQNGIHVMVEKPAVLKRHELQKLVRAWKDSKKILFSNLVLRASPRFIELKKLIQSQKLGNIFYIEGDYLHNILWKLHKGWRGTIPSYSVIYGGGIHLIDIMRFLLDAEISEVSSMGTNILSQNSPYPSNDTIVSLLRFQNNILAKCTSSFATFRPQLHALNVFGSKGSWHNNTPHASLFLSDENNAQPIPIKDPYPGIQKSDLLESFIASIQGETPQINIKGEDVIRIMDVCLTAQDALEKKKTLPVSYSL